MEELFTSRLTIRPTVSGFVWMSIGPNVGSQLRWTAPTKVPCSAPLVLEDVGHVLRRNSRQKETNCREL